MFSTNLIYKPSDYKDTDFPVFKNKVENLLEKTTKIFDKNNISINYVLTKSGVINENCMLLQVLWRENNTNIPLHFSIGIYPARNDLKENGEFDNLKIIKNDFFKFAEKYLKFLGLKNTIKPSFRCEISNYDHSEYLAFAEKQNEILLTSTKIMDIGKNGFKIKNYNRNSIEINQDNEELINNIKSICLAILDNCENNNEIKTEQDKLKIEKMKEVIENNFKNLEILKEFY